jgi:hypothetical protein
LKDFFTDVLEVGYFGVGLGWMGSQMF